MAAKPVIEVRVYDADDGDPVPTDRGFGWYDPVATSWKLGTFSVGTDGVTSLEYLEGIGIACRPFVVRQDTRLAQYGGSGGSWQERRPYGGDRKYRLVQTDASPGVTWYRTSRFALPANPQVAFSILLGDTPAGWDNEALPSYLRIEFGGGTWALHWGKEKGYLLQASGGAWTAVAEIPRPEPSGNADGGECLVLLRCLRGKIGVSVDGGKEYVWHSAPDGSAIEVKAGPYTWRGQGGVAVLGLHQVLYRAGSWTSSARNTFTARVAPTATFAGRYATNGGTLLFADASTPSAGIARYRAEFTPKLIYRVPFSFYATPELYAGEFHYPVLTTTPAGRYTTPWAGRIHHVEIDKPYTLSESSCTLLVMRKHGEAPLSHMRRRKIAVLLGTDDGGGVELTTAFVGYVDEMIPRWEQWGYIVWEIKLVNLAERFRRAEWTPLDSVPLGGRYLNQAMDAVLASEGFGPEYRAWDAVGDRFWLAAGSPEDPTEWVKCGERKWETLQRLAGYAKCECAVSDGGILLSGPMDYAAVAVSHTYKAAEDTTLDEVLRELSTSRDYGESATTVIVTGTSEGQTGLLAWARDLSAEGNPASERFAGGWREIVQEEVPNTASAGMLISRAAALGQELFKLKEEPEVSAYVRLGTQRRDRVALRGCAKAGIPDGTQCVVLTLKHIYHMEPESGEAKLETVAGLRRL